jgi:outer membrane protein assembly factor BamD (BamD/ComL family)
MSLRRSFALRKIVVLLLVLFSLVNCVSNKNKKTVENPVDFDGWIMKSQAMTNRGKYLEAVNILNETMVKFPDTETLNLNYNIGYNYYKLKKYDDAKRYFNRVISFFESNSSKSQEDIEENRKYVVLSGLMLDRIQKDFEAMKDPYHVLEELAEKEQSKVSPKKKK